ncbi:unnamed protein product [Somion occarium]|uniref:N-acetyltransferase domain-containing protein n=1 Tax=Somion occarium TaxID=3059160 RepID=A0ABP1CNF9_9APHY
MRANANTIIVDEELILVPYREEHVAKYHEWMLNPELRELTASEPLSLEEEYEMQRKWQDDEDKLTFIICVREPNAKAVWAANDGSTQTTASLVMIGDVNLFFKGSPLDEDFEVEAEVMIADPAYRRRGYASRALQLLLSYATSPSSPAPLPIPPHVLVVRIGEGNGASLRVFERLGFVITKRVEVFKELEMRFRGSTDVWKQGVVRPYDELPCF